ncbi:hypothetical protein CYLTODRAFT_459989 [Cylindrobasidium torrendii FP15055 ss-10]|uniref:Uncharacterized protein n=1 Tax=Cylindrobasidium torrendii FP15055 ss-10 TaxID=1314674 RepID=A0A0D7ATW2_9AGAR|nr:hypothetical protein CYLTODRAFT_459989 [Cylindrobasidium torrendii FP15055 ss-10]
MSSRELYGSDKRWCHLKNKEKRAVRDAQYHRYKWRNDHEALCVFSTACESITTVLTSKGERRACNACYDLLRANEFRAVLRKPLPLKENLKYTNKMFRSRILGGQYASVLGLSELVEEDAQGSLFLRFSVGALQSKFDDDKVFLGLVHAMVQKADKNERGVGSQNFQHAPAYDEFVGIHAQPSSTCVLPVQRLKKPRLPPVLCDLMFKRVKERLSAIEYTGPVALACDDTKLLSGLRLYWDATKHEHLLIEGIHGPVLVTNPEDVHDLMQDRTIPKTTKVRVCTVQVPLPKMVPIVVAALPIGNSTTAKELLPSLAKVVHGLLDQEIDIVSYTADRVQTFSIPSHAHNHPDMVITIAFFRGHPIALLQDSKHLAKTFRNNLFSGARLLVLGNYTTHFLQMLKVVHHTLSPLYKRDVLKTDRQDDNAALRTLSAALLDFLTVCGEMHDAFQNRDIGHDERIKMILRTYYFFQTRSAFLQSSPIYSVAANFISYPAADIVHTLVTGFISLVIIHRDYIPTTFPLLPWLHSSEPCEHVFGMARQLVKDFTMVDFLHMVPKLDVRLRRAVLRLTHDNAASAKARVSGYNHSYFNAHNINLAKLSAFPSNDQIQQLALDAAAESDSLVSMLGLMPEDMRPTGEPASRLPGISALLAGQDKVNEFEDHLTCDDCEELEEYEENEKAELLKALSHVEDPVFRKSLNTRKERRRADNLTRAAIALETDDYIQLQASTEFTETEEEENFTEDMRSLRAVEVACEDIPDVNNDSGAAAN